MRNKGEGREEVQTLRTEFLPRRTARRLHLLAAAPQQQQRYGLAWSPPSGSAELNVDALRLRPKKAIQIDSFALNITTFIPPSSQSALDTLCP